MLADAVETGHYSGGLFSRFGLSSSERGRPPALYKTAFETSEAAGIFNSLAYYGEDGPAEYVASAISDLHFRRVDYGIRAVDDPALIKASAEGNVLLAVYSISNVRLKSVKQIEDVPIKESLLSCIPFPIGSDNPAYFNAYILENYCAIQEAFILAVDN